MIPSPLLAGAPAVRRLISTYPGAHHFFGLHKDAERFGQAISQPGWLVLECRDCWLMTQDIGDGRRDLHWFCPKGAHMPALRRMLRHIFDHTGTDVIVGTTPKGHPSERLARTLARAVGAERDGDSFVLSRERFLCYTGWKMTG